MRFMEASISSQQSPLVTQERGLCMSIDCALKADLSLSG
jgi:hypothetical protein